MTTQQKLQAYEALAICQKSRSCTTTVLTVQTTNRNNNTYMQNVDADLLSNGSVIKIDIHSDAARRPIAAN